MEIVEFFSDSRKEHWKKEIEKSDWRASGFLLELLGDTEKLDKYLGDNVRLFLLTDNEKLAAFVTLAKKDCIIDEALYPWIGFVYTFPEYRGNRYSQRLIRYAENQAVKDGYSRVYICTNHEGLYEKYGFIYMESREDCWGDMSRILYKELNW